MIRLFAAAVVLALGMAPARAADAEHGKQVFAACLACHSTGDADGALGPSLKGVVGRKAAERPDFRYSGPMQRSGIVWTEANLKAYLEDPQAVVRGNRMPFSGLPEPKDADDVVAYLETLK